MGPGIQPSATAFHSGLPKLVGPLSLTGTSPKVAISLTVSGMGLAYCRYPMMSR